MLPVGGPLPAAGGGVGVKRKKGRFLAVPALLLGLAATYSPGCDPSTIGASGLNFSVRDGKRCSPEP